MKLPIIKQFNGANNYHPHSFFTLCKGENSGKPLNEPCPNCFVVTCADAQQRDYWFWLSWGLWKSKSFYQLHRGSVIPFIRICDYTEVIEQAGHQVVNNRDLLDKAIATMRDLEELEAATRRKLLLIREARVAVFSHVLKR